MITTTLLPATTTTSRYVLEGGRPLQGTVRLQGAKNAVLPMIAAALLPKKGQTILRNVPSLNDVYVSIELARSAGARVEYHKSDRVLVIDASSVTTHRLDSALTTKSRGSILFLPAILHRLGKVEINGVGGCKLSFRKLNFHYNGFKRLGARVEGDHDRLSIMADQLKGDVVYLDTPTSQTSTENLMMAASLAKGTTIIENATSEPELVNFAEFLTKMGAQIQGVGTRTIIIDGVDELQAVEHTVMFDPLDAGAFMMAAAITSGNVVFPGVALDFMRIFKVKMEQMGVQLIAEGPPVRVKGPKRLRPVNISTWPYPGFVTDFLASAMTLSTLANGRSYFHENVFEDRFTHIDGLRTLGAQVTKYGSNAAYVDGIERLRGGSVDAPDIRAGMAYVLAGLAAEGETVISNIYQIERGHEEVVERLQELGARIERRE